ncbi:hypothetical protein M3Y94_01083000 [Aphelenchoides besseyi]|nr:hypothetical protein M3Y94_01083000 [Aphelenchoides besseyi]KAI6218812.1 hypothetical protein M3Y95_01155400 [Aphelenchoides besseyi]
MSVPVNQLESPYVLDGRVHVTHYTYACVAISCLCGFLSAVFLPGYFAVIGIIVPPLIHGVLIAAIWQRWIHMLQTGLALFAITYICGLISVIVCLAIELGQSKRGSWKLDMLHASALFGLWNNILLFAMYGLHKVIKVYKQDYSVFQNDEFTP